MNHSTGQPPRRGGRGPRPYLIIALLIGLVFFVGGLAGMAVVALTVPEPETIEGWRVLRAVVRTAVLRGVLPGAFLTFAAGIGLFMLHPRVFLRLRWFRLKAAIIVVATPALHLWARGRVEAFDAALAAGRLDEAAACWARVGHAFVVALAIYLLVMVLGRFKPRLGERPGGRRA